MSIAKLFGVVIVSILILQAFDAASAGLDDFKKGIHNFDKEIAETSLQNVVKQANSNPSDFIAQWEAAEAHRLWSAQLRESRLILKTDAAKTHKDLQLKMAVTGQVYAEKALALSSMNEEISKANRVLGELHSLQIEGMVSGFRQGPKARGHILKSLKSTPEDPESLRAIGLMYLHNPPISGGDLSKAIKTFSKCVETDEESAQYALLLAMAYKKKGQVEQSTKWAEKAIELNPKNKNAHHFLTTLEVKEK